MTTPPLPPREQSLRDNADVGQLRAELDRLATENASLRTALAQASLPNSAAVRTLVRRRWIGGLASILLLVLAFALGVWYTRLVGHDVASAFMEGFNAATTTLSPAAPPAPAPAAGTPTAPAPEPPAQSAPRGP